MAGGWIVRPLVAIVLAGLLGGWCLSTAARSQGPDDLTQLLAEVRRLRDQGHYGKALPIAERAVALARQRYGEEHVAFRVS
jgi:hypothetical protein